jgi:hypothetical protein
LILAAAGNVGALVYDVAELARLLDGLPSG